MENKIYTIYVCLGISEMDDSSDIKDREEEVERFCYDKVFALLMNCNSNLKADLESL
jgi:hypothetical protein